MIVLYDNCLELKTVQNRKNYFKNLEKNYYETYNLYDKTKLKQ